MFTGIIEQVGRVLETTSSAITIEASRKEDDPFQIGESIAVNGCCLTLARSSELTFALSEETLRKTNLGSSRQGDRVNLERAMKVGARFGGHVVQGHVNTTATFDSIHETAQAHVMRFRISSDAKYVIEKGSDRSQRNQPQSGRTFTRGRVFNQVRCVDHPAHLGVYKPKRPSFRETKSTWSSICWQSTSSGFFRIVSSPAHC